MKEFFGYGGYTRPAEGYLSWQHITFVSALMVIMTGLAVYFGLKNRNREYGNKNKVIIISAIAINFFELSKIITICVRSGDPLKWIYELPLFMCSMQLVTIPLAAFSKGRIKEAALDNVFIFGTLGAVFGTYFAGNNYSVYPVLSFDNVVSGITHSISGFTSLYIAISGMVSMKKKNVLLNYSIITCFSIAAYVVNRIIDYNYMFLIRGDGTPYDIAYNIVNGNTVLYPLFVVFLFILYISVFYYVYFLVQRKRKNGYVS